MTGPKLWSVAWLARNHRVGPSAVRISMAAVSCESSGPAA